MNRRDFTPYYDGANSRPAPCPMNCSGIFSNRVDFRTAHESSIEFHTGATLHFLRSNPIGFMLILHCFLPQPGVVGTVVWPWVISLV